MSVHNKALTNTSSKPGPHNYLERSESAESLSAVSESGGEEDLLVKGEGRGDIGDRGKRGELHAASLPPTQRETWKIDF